MGAIVGLGQIAIWQGGSLWVFRAGSARAETAVHAHHSLQIAFLLRGAFTFVAGEEAACGPITAIAPDHPHQFSAAGAVAHLFIEPESPVGRALGARLFRHNALASLDTPAAKAALADLRRHLEQGGGTEELESLGKRIAVSLAPLADVSSVDPRVLAMIEHATSELDTPPSLASTASAVCLSPSRARHLFVEGTGIPFKAFVLWLRLKRAVECYAAGETLTVAAHSAGFADSAHLSRTFRRTFGLPAATLRIQRY